MAKNLKDIILRWQKKADNDLAVALRELSTGSPITDAVCFHCQQAAEKYLKLYLVFKSVEPRKTHLISDLIIECSKYDNDFDELHDVSYLSDYAVELRYPDDFSEPDIEEANEAYQAAARVKKLVIKKTGL